MIGTHLTDWYFGDLSIPCPKQTRLTANLLQASSTKDNMEKQWHLLEEAGQLQLLPETDRKNLERLLLGPYKRGLYREPPQYGNVLT